MKTASETRSAAGLGFGAKLPRGRDKDASDKGGRDIVQLDPLIHERARLSILTALFTLGPEGCSFSDLRHTLSLTDGNLMAHLRTLEVAHLIDRTKAGAGRNSNTQIHLTATGRKAFSAYLDQLEQLLRSTRGR